MQVSCLGYCNRADIAWRDKSCCWGGNIGVRVGGELLLGTGLCMLWVWLRVQVCIGGGGLQGGGVAGIGVRVASSRRYRHHDWVMLGLILITFPIHFSPHDPYREAVYILAGGSMLTWQLLSFTYSASYWRIHFEVIVHIILSYFLHGSFRGGYRQPSSHSPL